MIVSHKYQFIHIKNGKVGGTSLEIALSKFLGPDDIVTTHTKPDEIDRYNRGFTTAQNFQKTFTELIPKEWPMALRSQILSKLCSGKRGVIESKKYPARYKGHMRASDIKRKVGEEVWNSYFKFAVERNPWDKVVSAYYWDRNNTKEGLSFRDFVLSGEACQSNFEYYTLNGIFAIDRLLKYENLANELEEVSNIIGLPENLNDVIKDIKAKGGYRKKPNYREFYDKELHDVIDIFFAREIKLLGYEF
jgi:hypothetical protein